MAYIDQTYFATYTTTAIPAGEFAVLAERASDVIDLLTQGRIDRGGGLSALPADTQTNVKKSTAAQVEILYAAGGVGAINGDNIASGSLGKFSYQAVPGLTVGGMPVSALVYNYLSMSGLLYRGLWQWQ